MLSLVAPSASAQGIPGVDTLTLTLSPKHPRPYDTVKVTVSSTLVNLAASEITITANGEVVAERSRTASVTFGGPGTKTTIRVVAVAPDATHVKELTIAPADVVLIVESPTSAHPFYEGARLVASEGPVRLVALPDFQSSPGVRIPAKDLSYTWRFGDRLLHDYSGLGQNVLPATAPVRYRDADVTVTVTTRDGTLVAETTQAVVPTDPVMRIYRNDPLLGPLFEHALSGTYRLPGAEDTLRMIPYFFSGTPTLAWTLNGNPAGGDDDLTLRATGNEGGTASVRASASEIGGTLPRIADSGLTVEFGGKSVLDSLFSL